MKMGSSSTFSAGVVVVVLLVLLGLASPAVALKVNTTLKDCSTTCESKNCIDPFNLRYGKYCGIGYTGCDGQPPCDGIDSCCLTHDNCIGSNLENYVNRTCNEGLKDCIGRFRDAANQPQFAGANCTATEVESVLVASMNIATLGTSAGSPRSPPTSLPWLETAVSLALAVVWSHI